MTVQIPLTRGFVALVDDEDAEWLSQWKWRAKWNRSGFYAARTKALPDGTRGTVFMHRLILGLTDPKELGDHRNGNTLDNTHGNLRKATFTQNSQNSKARIGRLKGIAKCKGHYRAYIYSNRKQIHLGMFDCPNEAHEAYCRAAVELFGEFARVA